MGASDVIGRRLLTLEYFRTDSVVACKMHGARVTRRYCITTTERVQLAQRLHSAVKQFGCVQKHDTCSRTLSQTLNFADFFWLVHHGNSTAASAVNLVPPSQRYHAVRSALVVVCRTCDHGLTHTASSRTKPASVLRLAVFVRRDVHRSVEINAISPPAGARDASMTYCFISCRPDDRKETKIRSVLEN